MKAATECFFIDDDPEESGRPEINLKTTFTAGEQDDQVINCGFTPVVLDKLFGPLIFANLRIRADIRSCNWIVEREQIKSGQWEFVMEIPGQKESDFT